MSTTTTRELIEQLDPEVEAAISTITDEAIIATAKVTKQPKVPGTKGSLSVQPRAWSRGGSVD